MKFNSKLFQNEAIYQDFHQLILSKHNSNSPTESLSLCLMTPKGEALDMSISQPCDITVFSNCARNIMQYLTPTPGEVIITNDPYCGSTSLLDLIFVKGVFSKGNSGDLRFLIGAKIQYLPLLQKPSLQMPQGVDGEGIRIPPVVLYSKNQINSELVLFLEQSGLSKNEFTEMSQVIDKMLTDLELNILDLEKKWGKEPVASAFDWVKDFSHEKLRRILAEIPDGDYLAHDYLDDDGAGVKNVKINCKFSIHGEKVVIDFAGTAKSSQGPFNCTYSSTMAACIWALLSLSGDDEIPLNSGLLHGFSVETPEDCLVNAKYPHACLGGYFETIKRVAGVTLLALSKALPRSVPAPSSGSNSCVLYKFDSGKLFLDFLTGGTGAGLHYDGVSGIQTDVHNFKCLSVEEIETNFPIRVLHLAIRNASGGTGNHSGGLGLSKGILVSEHCTCYFMGDRTLNKAQGLMGGTAGNAGEIIFIPAGSAKKSIQNKCRIDLKKGSSVLVNSPGGGGWGKVEEPDDDEENSES